MLVAAGLTAPFVPIYSRLRARRGRRPVGQRLRAHGPDRRGRRHGDRERRDLPRGAVARRRRRRGLRPGDPGPVRPARPDQLPRAGHVRGVDRARRDPRGPPPVPVLRARPDLLHDRDHRLHGPLRAHVRDRGDGLGRGRRCRRPPHDPGDRHDPDDVPDPAGLRAADRGVRRVPAPDGPADVLGRHRAADDHLLHAAGGRPRGRRGLGAQLRSRLPGPAGQPHRRLVLARRLPGPLGRLRR